ncbi:MAG: hypothetical protein JWO31_2164 [Phycisphaerales bacterium]|nr:hypothetical protein [Phycisphaerales bacterium]
MHTTRAVLSATFVGLAALAGCSDDHHDHHARRPIDRGPDEVIVVPARGPDWRDGRRWDGDRDHDGDRDWRGDRR